MKRRPSSVRKDVPFLTKKRIEEEAALLLAEWEQEHGKVAVPPVQVDEIVELQLKLTIEFKNMREVFPFADVHGAIWMQDERIGIDQSLDPTLQPRKLGRYRFTLAHEAGHWRLHRQHYLENPDQRSLFDAAGNHPTYVCRSSDSKKPVEWQADYFGAALLMPRDMVRTEWLTWRGNLDVVGPDELRARMGERTAAHAAGGTDAKPEDIDNELMRGFCRPLAEPFQVSADAMRIRLEEMGLLVRVEPNMLF